MKTINYGLNLWIILIADSKMSLYKKLAGNFKVGRLSDLINSHGIKSKRDLNVLSVIFWNSVGKQSRLNQLMRL